MSSPLESQPFFAWFISFGNILTLGISVATISVFVWKFAKFLRAEMKKDAMAIKDEAVKEIRQVDNNVNRLKETVIEWKQSMEVKLDDIKKVSNGTADKLDRIDREGTSGMKQLDVVVHSMEKQHEKDVEYLKKDLTEFRRDYEDHVVKSEKVVEWGKDIAAKLEIANIRQKTKLDEVIGQKKKSTSRNNKKQVEEEEEDDNLSNTSDADSD